MKAAAARLGPSNWTLRPKTAEIDHEMVIGATSTLDTCGGCGS